MTGRPGRRRAAALVALIGMLAWLAVEAPAALAHAYVLATTPSNGAEVSTAPAEIRVSFSEPVTLPSAAGSTSVLDASGANVGNGSTRLLEDRRTLLIGVRPGVPKGSYIASWSVVSADSHPVGGSIQFGYGVPAVASAAAPSGQSSAGLQLLVGIVKGILYLALIAALGLVPAALVLGADGGERRILWRVARTGAVLSIVVSVLQVLVQYLWDASAVAGGATWNGLAGFAGSNYAGAVSVRIGLLVAAVIALPPPAEVAGGFRSTGGRWAAVRWAACGGLAVAILGSVVRNGHGGGAAWWQFVSTLVHAGAVVCWLGGLAVLGWLVLRRRLSLRRLLRLPIWSRYAAAAVGLLALTGTLQGLVQVRHPGALVSTTYGYVLIVKLALVAVALMLGLRGNRWIARQLARLDGADPDGGIAPGETARLRGRVRVEAGVGAAVVVVSGLLSSVAPASAAYAPRRVIDATIGPYDVRIEVAPARRGPESFRVRVRGRAEATPPARSVDLDLGQASGAVRALPVSFPYRLPGSIRPGQPTGITFVSSAVNVPVTGLWTGTLTLVAGRTEQYTAEFAYQVL